jgi:hypothetical protein
MAKKLPKINREPPSGDGGYGWENGIVVFGDRYDREEEDVATSRPASANANNDSDKQEIE